MSERLLKAMLRLFALVALEDKLAKQERDQIRQFLEDNVSQKTVDKYLELFDEYTQSFSDSGVKPSVDKICQEISTELTQKQKVIVVLDLVNIIFADGKSSEREENILDRIAENFQVSATIVSSIKTFVRGGSSKALDHPNVLIIDGTERFSQAYHIKRNQLQGFIAILYVVESELFFIKYQGQTDVFFNGVPVKSGVIKVLAVGSTLRWEGDEPVYYGGILSYFKKFGDHSRTSFEATDISYQFKNGALGLRNVSLSEESGNLIALMGASGAGKSTLLHVLNGTEKPSSGSVLVNGIDIHREPDRVEGVIGFVPQDDLLIEDLTVYQNLYYAAKLCFSDKREQEIDTLVLKVLADLGLEEIKMLKVGSPLNKTISGGQRKRLNIGLELLREPAVLFCDEPTSGLSSRDSENIIDLLKELSFKGKLVFAVIHQPSSDIYKMFDKLLVLDTGGYQIYYGNPIDAIIYFKKSINMINSEEGECHECGNVNPEQVFNIIETKVINEYGHFTNERKILPEQWNSIFLEKHKPVKVTPSPEEPHSTLRIPNRLKQIHLFSLRDIQAKIHNTQYMLINILEAPVLAFILAFIVRYYNVDDQSIAGYVFGKNVNIPAYFFMSVIVALFMGLTVSAEEIIRDRKILKREAFLHLSRSSYLLSKISILFMLSAIQTLLFVLVGSFILEIKGTIIHHWAILFTASCFANLLGLNISSAFNSAVTIYILIPILLIPQLILSGVVVKFDKLNPAIGNTATVPFVGDLMASRWAFEATMVTQFKDNPFERTFYAWDKDMAQADYKKLYFIPEMETKLQFCLNNYHVKDSIVKVKMMNELKTFSNEIVNEFRIHKPEHQIDLAHYTLEKFDSSSYQMAFDYLAELKKIYIFIFNRADQQREKAIYEMTKTDSLDAAFNAWREAYHNETITDLVKNIAERHRIIEKDNRLVQKIYPIYKDPNPEHMVDFDAQFYMPTKHFLNRNVDTLYFNLGVIWSMCLALGAALYFDVLRRIIDGLGNISSSISRK